MKKNLGKNDQKISIFLKKFMIFRFELIFLIKVLEFINSFND